MPNTPDTAARGPEHGAKVLRGKRLTEELRRLAGQAVTITDDGTPVTRERLLAEMIWRQALGWKETKRDEHGNRIEIDHPPVAWTQQFLWERLEGRAAPAVQEQEAGIRAVDRVRDLAKQRLNALVSPAKKSPPPVHTPKKGSDHGRESDEDRSDSV